MLGPDSRNNRLLQETYAEPVDFCGLDEILA